VKHYVFIDPRVRHTPDGLFNLRAASGRPFFVAVHIITQGQSNKRSTHATLSHGQGTWRSTLLGLGVRSPGAEAIEELR
jgi:hypothetical protein